MSYSPLFPSPFRALLWAARTRLLYLWKVTRVALFGVGCALLSLSIQMAARYEEMAQAEIEMTQGPDAAFLLAIGLTEGEPAMLNAYADAITVPLALFACVFFACSACTSARVRGVVTRRIGRLVAVNADAVLLIEVPG